MAERRSKIHLKLNTANILWDAPRHPAKFPEQTGAQQQRKRLGLRPNAARPNTVSKRLSQPRLAYLQSVA